jgi:phosphoserine aminotransferase
MTIIEKPRTRPERPLFSSGPCVKRPGWSPDVLRGALVGRSHRSSVAKERLKLAITKTRQLLELPGDYLVAIVPGSDTGAFEMAMWSTLGARGIEVAAWESFGKGWVTDIQEQLQLKDVRIFEAPYGELPNVRDMDFDRDVVFTWNGTTSGVRVPSADFIPHDRQGLTLIDATSAVFAQPIDWAKTDVVAYSWQKVLGGEAAHGILILSPRAVERIESYVPAWPLPKLFRMTKGGKLDAALFDGETINTPSMLCVEDYLDALAWAEGIGGLQALYARANANAKVLFDWIERTPWIANLALAPETRSNTSVCLRICKDFGGGHVKWTSMAQDIVHLLAKECVAFDIGSYRDAPDGFRIWTGATVETADLESLMTWLDWAVEIAASQVRDDI